MHLSRLCRRIAVTLLFLGLSMAFPMWKAIAQSDTEPPAAPRKVVNRVVPSYPELAKTMNLHGTVKVEALVLPNGSVKSTKIVGGHPVLAQAAERAVQKWRWVPAAKETSEPVEVHFDPH